MNKIKKGSIVLTKNYGYLEIERKLTKENSFVVIPLGKIEIQKRFVISAKALLKELEG